MLPKLSVVFRDEGEERLVPAFFGTRGHTRRRLVRAAFLFFLSGNEPFPPPSLKRDHPDIDERAPRASSPAVPGWLIHPCGIPAPSLPYDDIQLTYG